jgi:hypothetical protein
MPQLQASFIQAYLPKVNAGALLATVGDPDVLSCVCFFEFVCKFAGHARIACSMCFVDSARERLFIACFDFCHVVPRPSGCGC